MNRACWVGWVNCFAVYCLSVYDCDDTNDYSDDCYNYCDCDNDVFRVHVSHFVYLPFGCFPLSLIIIYHNEEVLSTPFHKLIKLFFTTYLSIYLLMKRISYPLILLSIFRILLPFPSLLRSILRVLPLPTA